MAFNLYARDTAAATFVGPAVQSNDLTLATAAAATLGGPNTSDTAFGTIDQGWEYTYANDLASGSNSWSATLDIQSFSGTVTLRFRLARYNSGGTLQASTAWSSDITTAGEHTINPTWDPGTWASGDRLVLEVDYYRSGGHGNVSAVFNVNDANGTRVVAAGTAVLPDLEQVNFRGRTVNANAAAANAAFDASDPALNSNFSADTDAVVGLRFEVQNDQGATGTITAPRLYYRVNRGAGFGAWTEASAAGEPWPYITGLSLDEVEIIQASGFTDGTATTNLISGSAQTFKAGSAEHNNDAATITLNQEHTEWEYRIVIPRWFDTGSNDAGDVFEFRIQDGSSPLDTYTNTPSVTVAVPDGHIGGAYIEQPTDIGPFKDSNGNLYVFTEQSVVTNELMVHKSADGGVTWDQVDGANRPTTTDPEALDVKWNPNVTGELLIASRHGNTDVYHHIFRTSDHATNADTWGTVDQLVDNTVANEPSDTDSVSIVPRDHSGTLFKFIFFTGGDGTNGRIYWSFWNGATWSSPANLDTAANTNFTAVSAVYEPNNDVIRVFYMDHSNGDMYMVTFASGSTTPSARTQVATNLRTTDPSPDRANLLPVVAYDDAGVDVSVYGYTRDATLRLSTEHLRDGVQQGEVTSVIDNDVDRSNGASHQQVASLAVDGTTVYLIYSDATTQDIYYTTNPDEAGWATDTEHQDGVSAHFIRSMVFTHSSGNGGAKVLGYVWDGGSDGFSGFVRYDELVIEAGGTPNAAFSLAGTGSTSFTGKKIGDSAFALSGTGSVALDGVAQFSGSLALNGTASVSLTGKKVGASTFSLSGTGSTSFTGQRQFGSPFALAGTGSVSLTGHKVGASTFSLAGTGSTSFTGKKIGDSAFALSGTGSVALDGVAQFSGTFTLSGTGSTSFTGQAQVGAPFSLAGTGSTSFTGKKIGDSAFALSGTGSVTFTGGRLMSVTIALAGTGSVTFTGSNPAQPGSPFALSGTGSVALTGGRLMSATIALGGTGSVTFTGGNPVNPGSPFALSGTGSVTLSGNKVGRHTLALSGTGSVGLGGGRLMSAVISLGGTVSVSFTGYRTATQVTLSLLGTASVAFGGFNPDTLLTHIPVNEVTLDIPSRDTQMATPTRDLDWRI